MGDGGVACVPSQHIMEKFSICGGKTNGNTKLSSSSNSSTKLAKVSPSMKPRKDKGTELGSKDFGSLNKEVAGAIAMSEIEKGEFVPGKWRKSGTELEKNDWRSSKDELEKGEFVPDRWCRSDAANRTHEYGYSKSRRYDTPKEKGRKSERERTSPAAKERGLKVDRDTESTPLSGRGKGWKADRESPLLLKRKAGGVTGSVSGHHLQQTQKISSKIPGDEGSLKNDLTNSKNHAREYSFSNRLKRHGKDSNSSDRKFRGDHDEYSTSKKRKLSNDGSRSGFSSDHYSGRTTERQYKTATSSSRSTPTERQSSRYLESSRAVHDRHNSSPHHPERSPRNWAFNHDHSPARRSTPSHDQGPKHDRSRSPYDHNHHHDNRYQSPNYVERSPRDHDRNSGGRDRTPTFLDRSPRDRGRYSDHRENKSKSWSGREAAKSLCKQMARRKE
ncbi:Histone-lysine N-methyltransferase ATXR3 [Sesamum angolense]|uniref:Histone-lysine N-methyltransferase ATXR3 n=1 Tax=Sesamum angolense TaxID=2727404 RepID=A0AAE1T3R9_9LAMI|nr:Histone-lysine N-methyltransferase ATXR3 [Sesamum angolense]